MKLSSNQLYADAAPVPEPTPGPSYVRGTSSSDKPLILHVFPTFAFGGVPIRMSRVIEHLADRYRHVIVSLDGRFDSKSRIGADVDVRYLEFETPKGRTLKAMLKARTTLGAIAADLLMTYNWGAIEWALARTVFGGGRHIHCESGFGAEEANGQIKRRCLLRRVALMRTDHLIVPSHTLVEIATDQWRIGARRIVHIPNGVALDRFATPADPEACRRFGLDGPAAGPIVGTLTPLRPEKNLPCLLRAFADLPKDLGARLLVLGDGSEREQLIRLAEQLGVLDQVRFAGHVERPDLVLGAIDLFVMSSDTEQMPNSLIQAMAAGLAVAATDVGDVRQMLPAGSHPYLAPAGDHAGLTRAMSALLRDDDLRVELGRCNRLHAEVCFDERVMLERYTTILGACLEGP